jgi:hypothetical protein
MDEHHSFLFSRHSFALFATHPLYKPPPPFFLAAVFLSFSELLYSKAKTTDTDVV